MKRRIVSIVAAVLILLGVGQASAAEGGDAFDAHATTFKYFFHDGDMDFHFGNLILGSAVNGGVAIGEAFYAASRITDGDSASWQREWGALAERAEARGLQSLDGGHTVSARDQLLRAAYYYRLSLLGMLPDNPELARRGSKCRALMKKAGPLFDPPLEYFEVPFEGTVLPGLFRKAANSGKPAPTLIMIGGGETFIEDLFFYIAPQAHERGYNFMTVDLPGQGLLPLEGLVFRTDTYVPMKNVVDYALGRSDVDPERLAAFGISGGGQFVPQAAMHDPRIKAIAMSSAVVDGYPIFAAMPVTTATAEERQSWSSFHADVVKSICWRYGVDEPSELIEANRGNTFDPGKIAAPALMIVGEGEYRSKEVQRQQEVALDGLSDPRSRLVVTPSDEGASNHCIMENRSLVGQVLFDWLDEVFDR
ncbi:alpha/beta hydrolase [Salidesulfovibrio brasiliensis]|uniref:alpha/beta hydrolase n=1 Tax=Salidesulfovibrio brasiliensis TaxID=221711 RepID=UPI0006D19699|nr:alpha/beta hydrolase [Salidesulfovibrio brasiliensis]